ncbi:MAG: hypothetical protein EZS26_001865 [Candidatus Ordinivivax streblomastigis]|uniref:DUF6922 domain-containing protein n=1 Tax=Candidatus Ordinivivax streblomastigis TaxID=2540710 RepID=A0A5M8P0U4_9BACT|nr:MAG: hypothetical protein EZS26_001865 [Candidatus Ordinivivax streblomastigis]
MEKPLPLFSTYLFWDINPQNFDFETHKRFMIERVCSKGTDNDWNELFRYYGKEVIRKEVLQIPYMDDKTHNYLSVIFQIPKSKFKCYRTKQSRRNFWSC